MSKRFPTDLLSRGVLKLTDKFLVHNIDTGVTCYTTGSELLDLLGLKGQVKFPAVQVPSSNVNTLDDYKEGTFTPKLQFGGLSVGITYSEQTGYYTKIGNLVNIVINMTLTNKGSSVGSATITDLPFTVGANSNSPISISLYAVSFADFPAGRANPGSLDILLREITNAGVRTDLDNTNFANNSAMNISCTFRV
jgi:hypothetical protein